MKKEKIIEIENNYKIRIVLIPNQYYEFPNFKIYRVKSDEVSGNEQIKSYKVIEQSPEKNYISSKRPTETKSETAAVQHISVSSKQVTRPSKPSLLKRLWASFSLFSSDENLTQTTTNQHPERKYDHKKIQHRTEGSKKLRTNKNSRSKTNAPHKDNRESKSIRDNTINKIEAPKDKRTKQPNQYKKHHRQFIDEKTSASTKHEYQQDTSKVVDKNESPADVLYSKDNGPSNLASITPNDQDINLISNSNESFNNEKQQNQYEAVYDKATSYQKMDIRNREQNKEQTKESHHHKGSNAKTDRFQRKTASETQKQIHTDTAPNKSFIVQVQAEPEKPQEISIANSVNNVQNSTALEITPSDVFIKHSDRTKILPGSNLSKKRFYPKKKLPYEINKSVTGFEYNVESDLTDETNISENYFTSTRTDVVINTSKTDNIIKIDDSEDISTKEKNSLEENQK